MKVSGVERTEQSFAEKTGDASAVEHRDLIFVFNKSRKQGRMRCFRHLSAAASARKNTACALLSEPRSPMTSFAPVTRSNSSSRRRPSSSTDACRRMWHGVCA
nr:hypothetical protein SHINE37_41402 [Rhizobiaceae bacterium]